MDFSNNSHLKDYLRKKEMELEAKKAKLNKILEQKNRESFLKYQDFLRSQFAVAAADFELMTITGSLNQDVEYYYLLTELNEELITEDNFILEWE